MPFEPNPTGGANHKFYETPEIVASFDTVRQWLNKNFKKVCTFCNCI